MNIVAIPHPVLFQKAKPVATITPNIRRLVSAMDLAIKHAKNPKGVGLAAPQVGKQLRLFIIRLVESDPLLVFINPEIIETSTELTKDPKLLEGCLSIPTIWGPVKRHKKVKVRYQTIDGKERVETFFDLMATTVEHEMDHLNGTLFTARVLEQGGKLYRVEKGEDGKDAFKEIDF